MELVDSFSSLSPLAEPLIEEEGPKALALDLKSSIIGSYSGWSTGSFFSSFLLVRHVVTASSSFLSHIDSLGLLLTGYFFLRPFLSLCYRGALFGLGLDNRRGDCDRSPACCSLFRSLCYYFIQRCSGTY